MKPHGPIPPGYAADEDGMLLIGGHRADALADRAGDTPLFVYDSAMLAARAAEWRAAMPAEVQLHYAMKANPFAPLLAHMAGLVDGFDVASGGELAAALASGMAAGHIGPAQPLVVRGPGLRPGHVLSRQAVKRCKAHQGLTQDGNRIARQHHHAGGGSGQPVIELAEHTPHVVRRAVAHDHRKPLQLIGNLSQTSGARSVEDCGE